MDVRDDEAFKAAVHGLVLGVILIPLAYNVTQKKWGNVLVYTSLVGLEIYHIVNHVKDIA